MPLPHPTLHSLQDAERNFEALTRGPDWQAPTFESGWATWTVSPGYDARYAKTPTGLVVFRGLVAKSTRWTAFETIMTLPVGYRPGGVGYIVPTLVDDALGGLDVGSDGQVHIRSGTWASSSSWVSLAPLVYMAEN